MAQKVRGAAAKRTPRVGSSSESLIPTPARPRFQARSDSVALYDAEAKGVDAARKTIHRTSALHVTRSQFGYRGVEWDKETQRFRARIGRRIGRRWLGHFKTAEEAALACDAAARKKYGQHAALNFPRDGERRVVQSREELCPQGHSFKTFGYIAPDGNRSCRKCNVVAATRYKARRKARWLVEAADERAP
jgi:hypothetical protein